MNLRILRSQGSIMLLSTLAGIISGLYIYQAYPYASIVQNSAQLIAKIFIDLMQLISLPVIFLSIVATISNMESFEEMKKLGKKTLKYTLLTTLVAASIGLILFLLIDPTRSTIALNAMATEAIIASKSYLSFILEIIPNNILSALSDNTKVMSVVFIAALLSIAILSLHEEQKKPLQVFFASLFAATLKITTFIIFLMPFGVWAFISIFIADLAKTSNHKDVQSLLLYIVCILLANLLQGMIFLPLLLKIKKISPLRMFRGMARALTVAFFSKSSNATLPVTMECMTKELGVKERIANFTLPLCTVINMNGCAAFILITVLFVASKSGFTFSLPEMIAWVFIATLAAIGNAGVPMGCYFLASAFLVGMNVPQEGLSLLFVILPFYTIIDMVETALNVWSDGCVTMIIDQEIAIEQSPISAQE